MIESDLDSLPSPAPRFDRSDLISIIALVTSLAALFVTVYEAKILKDQQEIMQVQQKSAVWPYVEGDVSYEIGEDKRSITLKCEAVNRGIGPANIRNIVLKINDKEIASSEMPQLNQTIKKLLPGDASVVTMIKGTSGILAADQRKDYLTLYIKNVDNPLFALSDLGLDIKFCYCSLYEECWENDSNKNPVVSDCQL